MTFPTEKPILVTGGTGSFGKAFIAYALMTTMAWAFADAGLHRRYSSILEFNAASLGACVRKCGWKLDGVDREAVFRTVRFHNLYRVALLDKELLRHTDASESSRGSTRPDREFVKQDVEARP